MAVTGKVRIWHDEEGWGVLEAEETPGGCWAHFSHILAPGYRSFQPEQEVIFEWEAAVQDGYSFRAIRAWAPGVGNRRGLSENRTNRGQIT